MKFFFVLKRSILDPPKILSLRLIPHVRNIKRTEIVIILDPPQNHLVKTNTARREHFYKLFNFSPTLNAIAYVLSLN